MGIGTLRIQDLEYGQSHLTDGARRARRLWPAIITANGAQTKAELKRLITRCDRHEVSESGLDDEPIVDAGMAYDVACGNEVMQAEARRTMPWALHDAFDDDDAEPGFADFDEAALHAEAFQMLQAYEDDGIAFDVPTSSIYGTDLELWDADEWTQLGFSIVTPR